MNVRGIQRGASLGSVMSADCISRLVLNDPDSIQAYGMSTTTSTASTAAYSATRSTTRIALTRRDLDLW
ncbi:MAG: hypothetical protein QME92_13015 [Bacillota bacterium]|nr:hypothetical protein [Bacillota bacterium]